VRAQSRHYTTCLKVGLKIEQNWSKDRRRRHFPTRYGSKRSNRIRESILTITHHEGVSNGSLRSEWRCCRPLTSYVETALVSAIGTL